MVDKIVLIKELQDISKQVDKVTRDYFRANTSHLEADWLAYWPTWGDFCKAAGVVGPSTETDETHVLTANSWNIEIPKTQISTLEQLIEYCKIDVSIWRIDKCIFNKWDMGFKTGDGEASTQPLFQVKAFCTRKVNIVDARKELEALKDQFKKSAPEPKIKYTRNPKKGNVLEINIPDVHFGKLAWAEETGSINWDTKVTAKTFVFALDSLLTRVKHFEFDKILFVVGNDILNSDDLEGRTNQGTHVTNDTRYQKTFRVVRQTVIESIEKMRQIAPVEVIMVPGNHDTLSVWHLGDSLECYFHKYDDVKIDNSPKYRKYFQFGKVMLMFTHGDKGKRTDFPLIMATEQSKMFGDTLFRECHTGHNHFTKVDEFHGVRVRILPALCPPDDWHSEQGYVGQKRSAEAYVWNEKEGLIAQVFYNDDAFEPFE